MYDDENKRAFKARQKREALEIEERLRQTQLDLQTIEALDAQEAALMREAYRILHAALAALEDYLAE